MDQPKAYIFDVFGTLVDWRESVAKQAAIVFAQKSIGTDPHDFADYWRGRYQPAMQKIREGQRGYVALDDLHLENLAETLTLFGIDDQFSDAEKSQINQFWEHLDPWSDSVAGLAALKQNAIIAPCSNGSIALMTRLARHAGFPWDCILGAEIAQDYKPQPKVYLANCAALRLEPNEVMMVAAHNDDLAAARACGLQTAFIARTAEYGPHQEKDFEAAQNWERVISTIAELAE